MKSKILAAVLIASAAATPINTVQAGPLDEASFLAKVVKGKLIDRSRNLKKRVVCKLLPCLGDVKL